MHALHKPFKRSPCAVVICLHYDLGIAFQLGNVNLLAASLMPCCISIL